MSSIENDIVEYFDGCPEMLTNIFLNLSLGDRRNVRLSCRSFYNACNQFPIISQEIFVIRSNFSAREIEKTLMSCHRVNLKLELRGIPAVDSFQDKFWKHCGSRIQLLIFSESPVNDRVIKNMLLYCPNVKHLRLWLDASHKFHVLESGFHKPKPFSKLTQNGIVGESLETLELQLQGNKDWTSVVENILNLYPNTKTLAVHSNNAYANKQFVSSILIKSLKSSAIERLCCPDFIKEAWLKNASLHSIRLKDIHLWLSYSKTIFSTLMEFFSQQKNLEIIDLHFHFSVPGNLIKKLFLYLIVELSNLRSLKIRTSYNKGPIFLLDLKEISLVLKTRLKFLQVAFSLENFPTDSPKFLPNLPSSTRLHTLIFNQFEVSPHISVRILEHFQNLKCLHIKEVTDDVFQTILKNQMNLEALHISKLNLSRSFRISSDNVENSSSKTTYSIKILRNLKNLRIGEVDLENFPRDCIPEFAFPNLKELRFHNWSEQLPGHLMDVYYEIMNTCAKNSPELETIELHPSAFSPLLFEEKFHLKMKNLHTVVAPYPIAERTSHAGLINLFLEHESLCYIVYGDETAFLSILSRRKCSGKIKTFLINELIIFQN